MTGLEKLRVYALDYSTVKCANNLPSITGKCCDEYDCCKDCLKSTIDAIAYQIERETLPRPRFEDGEPVQFGDFAMLPKQDRSFKVERIEVYDNGWFAVSQHDGCGISAVPGFMFKRPEPPDSWERIEEDAYVLDVNFDEGTDEYARTSVIRDLVRRCKALAGVE